MKIKKLCFLLFFYSFFVWTTGNTQIIFRGKVVDETKHPLSFVNIQVEGNKAGAVTDLNGEFTISVKENQEEIELQFSLVGYQLLSATVTLSADHTTRTREFVMKPASLILDEVVVTGTRTFKHRSDNAVLVNVLTSESLEKVQACNLSEGLRFQPGLRVEVDCQTCNYSQLRMNGLGGGYSQILVNGRPIFSPLTGLYGLEQMPSNLVEQIEVVRGGGSALYGSSAIGGTVNVITKIPRNNSYELTALYQHIGQSAHDNQLSGNITLVNDQKNAGVSWFGNMRNRDFLDVNGDNFSELPKLRNRSVGFNGFFQPNEQQKLEANLSYLNEYRLGGEMLDLPAHQLAQSEERTHHVWMGGLDYQINFNENSSSFIAYLSGQHTGREHFTGVQPDEAGEIADYLNEPPYGTSNNSTLQAGIQLNQRFNLLGNQNSVWTLGTEWIREEIFDEIPAYRYLVDQTTKNWGAFVQNDWEISPRWVFLSGLRLDYHNFLEQPVWSPRFSLMYKSPLGIQVRIARGDGFRAPQAFDADLHIAFAGGGISRVQLANDLRAERSRSWSASVNYDRAAENFVAGFTLEGFYTKLNNAFVLEENGSDNFGMIFFKKNGTGATVQGATLELRANYRQKTQLETGFTFQKSRNEVAVSYLDGLPPLTDFIRTPDWYGYAIWSVFPSERFSFNTSLNYTGSMIVPHVSGAAGVTSDTYVETSAFWEINTKFSYQLPFVGNKNGIELFGGVKNLFNAYQSDFDIGKHRDSNYIYGPAMPRTLFVGLKLSTL